MAIQHVRKRLVTGLVVLIPLGITIFALRFLYNAATALLLPFLDPLLGHLPPWARALLSLGLLLTILLLVGQVATNVVGSRLIGLFEKVVLRIPIVRIIYQAAKQVVEAFNAPRSDFQTVVMVEFPRPGMRAVGFLTNTVEDTDGRAWSTVFIPTTPNPTTGFLQVVPAGEAVRLDWSVEDAVKTIMSLGVLAPPQWSAPLKSSLPAADT
ncbi:MAG: DUF502 domain-containing protein [Gemmatimonadota bacterium]